MIHCSIRLNRGPTQSRSFTILAAAEGQVTRHFGGRVLNTKPKATASASVDCYTLSADAVAFGSALNEIRPTGE
jgi:hypothetical protein